MRLVLRKLPVAGHLHSTGRIRPVRQVISNVFDPLLPFGLVTVTV